MKKHKQTILPLLLLVALLLAGLCDRAYAEESAQYPYLETFEATAVEFANGNTYDEGKDGKLLKTKTEWHNYEKPETPKNPEECDYVLGEIIVYTNGVPKESGATAKVTTKYTLVSGVTVTKYTPVSGKATKQIDVGKTMANKICFTANGEKYGYYLTVKDGSDLQEEKPTEIKLESIAVTRTADDTATAEIKSNVAGTYYYDVTEVDGEPKFDTTAAGTAMVSGVNTIKLTGLTAGAKKLHILAKSEGLENVTVSFDVPKYAVAHSLSAATSLLWEDQADQDTNRKGNVVFTNQSGTPITTAFAGETVTATAEPRNTGGWYEFAFEQWKNETGIKLTDEQRKTNTVTFRMPDADVTLFAEFKNVGTTVKWNSTPNGAPAIMVNGNTRDTQYVYRTGSTAEVNFNDTDWQESWVFLGWEIMINGENRADDPEYVTYPGVAANPHVVLAGDNVTITAKFRSKIFAGVTAKADPAMGSAAVSVGGDPTTSIPVVYEGQTVTLTATPGDRYTLTGWEVKEAGSDTLIEVTKDAEDANKATFTMPATKESITATAIFTVDPAKASTACVLENVELDIPGASVENTGTSYTITIPANTDADTLAAAVLKFTVSEYADVVTADGSVWPEDGKACGMTLDTPVTFTVRSEKCRIGKDDTAKADYTVTITRTKSTTKDITAVKLLNADKSVIAEGKLSGTTWTITLPSDTDKALINKIGTSTDVFMQINYTGVSLAQAEGYDDATGIIGKWSSGNVMCGISPNSSKTFTVTAEDGSTKTYTVEIKYTAPNAPTLSGGSATRSSKTAATVKFTSSEAGNYFYKVVDHGAAVPTVDTSKNGTSAVKGENTITLSNLTEDARDIYIVVVNASRGESAALKVEIPAYGSGSETPDTGKFTITINAPKGGTITTNRTKADKGDEIIVTVKPDSGYQMVEGSLTYSLAVAGGETVKITGNRFTMPAGNVTITCKWETATTTAKGITSFSISGVVGAVNNTTNTITITLPRGTDVTKLTPVIATNGVKSLTPGSGETVDFTNAVTYTAAMEDGSSKTYTVTVYVDKGTLADQFWDKLTDFATQVPWWQYAEKQQSTSKYPKYW